MLEVRPLAQGLRKAAVPAFCPSHLRVRGFIPRPARNPRHRRMCAYKKKGGGGHASASILRSHSLPTNSRIVLSIPEPRHNCLRMCTYEIAKISYLESTLAKKWGGVPPPGGLFQP